MDNQSLAHSRYNCTYNIVFIPKYRRKVMFGKLRKDVGEILGKVCKMEGVTILKAATLPEHVHMREFDTLKSKKVLQSPESSRIPTPRFTKKRAS